MTKLKPVLTEKSLSEAKDGNYTFWVDKRLNKYKIRKLIEDVFGVKVIRVRTINMRKIVKKSYTGRKKVVAARKKAMVTLSGKDKIDLFDVKGK